jgi:hypothetical protein
MAFVQILLSILEADHLRGLASALSDAGDRKRDAAAAARRN